MGLDWMLQDEEWKDAVWAADTPKTGEFWDKLYEAVQSKTLAEWNEVFENDHDVWAETMRRGSELLDHPQMQHLGAVVEIDDAERGLVRQPGPIVKMSEHARRPRPGRARAGRRRRRPAGSAVEGARRGGRGAPARARIRRGRALGDVTAAGARDLLRRAVRRHGAPRAGRPGDQGGAHGGRAHARPAAVPRGGRGEVHAGQGVHLRRSVHRRRPGDRPRRWPGSSDMVLQSFRAGVAERQGVDAETLRARSIRTSCT